VSADDITPLAGFTVAVTAERRRDEIAALLDRRGARVVTGSAISIVPLADDQALHAATAACIALAPDLVIATTGFGFRGWLEAAEGWGLGDALRSALQAASLVARGPKPCGAIPPQPGVVHRRRAHRFLGVDTVVGTGAVPRPGLRHRPGRQVPTHRGARAGRRRAADPVHVRGRRGSAVATGRSSAPACC
jgi:Uroporphyrinogen-III synthase HemD